MLHGFQVRHDVNKSKARPVTERTLTPSPRSRSLLATCVSDVWRPETILTSFRKILQIHTYILPKRQYKMDIVAHVVKFNSQTNGRDKLCR